MAFLGVEYGCKYVLTGPDGTRAVFNEPADADFVGVLSPESSGLDGPEIREDSAERVEDDGAIFGNFYAGKRPVILQGEISATSAAQRNERIGKLKRASNAKIGNATLAWTPQGAVEEVRVEVRRQQPVRITGGFLKSFQVSLVSADSRIVGVTLNSTAAVAGAGELKEAATKYLPSASPTSAAYVNYKGHEGAAWTTPANAKEEDTVFTTTTVAVSPGGHGEATTGKLKSTHAVTLGAGGSFSSVELFVKGKSSKPASSKTELFAKCVIIANGIRSTSLGVNMRFTEANTAFSLSGTHTTLNEIFPESTLTTKELSEALKTKCEVEVWFEPDGVTESYTLSIDDVYIVAPYVVGTRLVAENKGDVDADTIFTIKGPIENPTIENETTKEKLKYEGKVASTETVTFNTSARTAVSSVFGNVYNKVVFPTAWLKAQPGSNSFSLQSAGTFTASELAVKWRSSWE